MKIKVIPGDQQILMESGGLRKGRMGGIRGNIFNIF